MSIVGGYSAGVLCIPVSIEEWRDVTLGPRAKHYEGSTIANNTVKTRQDAGLPKTGNPIPALRKRETITFPDVTDFEPIPIGKIGLYKDEFRKSLPAVE
jgi:hypothetical protein